MNWHELLFWIAPLIGLSALGIGSMAIAAPAWASEKFGLMTEGSGVNYVVTTGARDIFIAGTILLLWWHADRYSLGVVFIFTAFVSFVDFMLTLTKGKKLYYLIHLSGVIFFLSYGSWLLA